VSDPRSPGPPDEAPSILPDDWAALAPLVDAVLDAPRERRVDVLDEVSGGDPARRAQVERLVAECEHDVPVLNRPAAERFSRLLVGHDEMKLPETLGGRYRIDRELGRGGMARVYLARDTKHARDVAVKVIRPELAASLGRDRFLREIGIAARLRHPNIVPVYDSGDADGLLYFVMPYEEGPSLRERLSRGESWTSAESVSALRDVARALVYAHEHGVVHRDVKPDNVMMSGGAAVVTDFGIAKAVSAATTGAIAGTLTQAGAGIGTPAYMAPEQAIGDPSTDHRADIYSFGCLAYELFGGHPPFHGLPSHQIIAAHVGTKPVPLAEVCIGVPDAVARLVGRCLEKNPAARPQSAKEVLAELEGTQTGPNDAVRRGRAWRTLPRVPLLVAGLLMLSGAGYVLARTRASLTTRPPDELTLAVLPFNSVGGDSVQADLASGFSDELATALFRVPGVRVMSRGAVGKYRGVRDIDPQKAGRELGARLLVMGTIRGSTGRLTVNTSLWGAENGEPLWGETFDRSNGDLTAVREDIVRAIEDTVRRRFGTPAGRPSGARRPAYTPKNAAYVAYLLGATELSRRNQNIHASVDRFRQAVKADSLYARAHSGLSLALALTPYFVDIPASAVAKEATAAAERAQRLDSTLAEPHVALGLIAQHAYQWDRASSEFQTAMRLRSDGEVEPLIQYGRHLLYRGRFDDGLAQFLEAQRSEPASAVVTSWVAFAYYLKRQLDSAVAVSDRALDIDPTNGTTISVSALTRLQAGRGAEARKLVALNPRSRHIDIYVLAATGDTAAVRERLPEIQKRSREKVWMSESVQAFLMLGQGDTAQALSALERATDANEMWPSMQSVLSPVFDPIRGSARYQALLRRVGLWPIHAQTTERPRSR
jgi:serine/threonine protein kinase/tetratricopeptide (TPR) repeat protein